MCFVLLFSFQAATEAIHVAKAAPPTVKRPTRKEIIAEVKIGADQIKKNKNFTKIAGYAKSLLPSAPKEYDITQLYNTTLLLADNDALTLLTKKVPVSKMDKLFAALQYMAISGRYTGVQLKKKGKVSFNTWLKKPLKKMTAANSASLQFGVPGSPSKTWTTVTTTMLYTGKYFTVHGINYCIVV